LTSENIGDVNYLRLYPKEEFNTKNYNPTVNISDVMGKNPFGNILSIAQLNNRIFISDNTNKITRIIKLNKALITEPN